MIRTAARYLVPLTLLTPAVGLVEHAAAVPIGDRSGSATFTATGLHDFVVPCGVDEVTVDAYGARGGAGNDYGYGGSNEGGLGGRAVATIPVEPGETLSVDVGGHGGDVPAGSGGGNNIGGAAGVNGGGTGGTNPGGAGYGGGGGGGMSNVDRAGTHLVVAGGGGGGGGGPSTNRSGGVGGGTGTNGNHGYIASIGGRSGGSGGAGGAGLVSGSAGSAGQGGAGAISLYGIGGGGGGVAGGGGGASESLYNGGGGGGGSGTTPDGTGMTDGVDAGNDGDGRVEISYTQGSCEVPDAPGGTVAVTPSTGILEDLTVGNVPTSPPVPAAAESPFAVVSYRITGLALGATVTVTIDVPETIDAVWKLVDGTYEPYAATFTATTVTLSLTDGGEGDDDGTADGTIVDPLLLAGPAAPTPSPDPSPDPSPTPTPTPSPALAATAAAAAPAYAG